MIHTRANLIDKETALGLGTVSSIGYVRGVQIQSSAKVSSFEQHCWSSTSGGAHSVAILQKENIKALVKFLKVGRSTGGDFSLQGLDESFRWAVGARVPRLAPD